MRSCETLSEADLNTSDHLPLAVDIMFGSVGRLEEGDSTGMEIGGVVIYWGIWQR